MVWCIAHRRSMRIEAAYTCDRASAPSLDSDVSWFVIVIEQGVDLYGRREQADVFRHQTPVPGNAPFLFMTTMPCSREM